MAWSHLVILSIILVVSGSQARSSIADSSIQISAPSEGHIQVLKVTEPGGEEQIRVFRHEGVVAVDTQIASHQGRLRELSDGTELIRMLYTEEEDLVDCQVETDPTKVEEFWKESLGLHNHKEHHIMDMAAKKQDIVPKEVATRLQSFNLKAELLTIETEEDHHHFTTMVDIVTLKRMCGQHQSLKQSSKDTDHHHRSARSLFIFPGTNWCGSGNQAAANGSQFGESLDLDKCCREHDVCPYYIDSMGSKYGHFNFGLYTLLHCACDEQ